MVWIIVAVVVIALVYVLVVNAPGQKINQRPKLSAPTFRESAVYIDGEGDYDHEVVGESHYQAALEQIVGGRTYDSAEHETIALLVPEPNNPHDAGAIAVSIDGHTVGYLSRADNQALAQAIAKAGVQGRPIMAGAMVVGGWDRGGNDRGSFGVRLDIPEDIEFKPLPT